MLGSLGWQELLIILAILALLFGASRIAGIGGALGRGIREFRQETRGEDPQPPAASQRAPAPPAAQQPAAPAPPVSAPAAEEPVAASAVAPVEWGSAPASDGESPAPR